MITLKEFQKGKKEDELFSVYGITDKLQIAYFMPIAYNTRNTMSGSAVKTIEGVFGNQNDFYADDCFLTEKEATDELIRRLENYIKELKERKEIK